MNDLEVALLERNMFKAKSDLLKYDLAEARDMLKEIQADLKTRADIAGDGVVPISGGIWDKLNEFLDNKHGE